MLTFLTILHLMIAVALIFFVLIQDSKGDAMSMLGGGGAGGSNSLFGSTGAANFLVKATRWVAIIFSVTCIALAVRTNNAKKSIVDDYVPTAAPAVETQKAEDASNLETKAKEENTAPEASEKEGQSSK